MQGKVVIFGGTGAIGSAVGRAMKAGGWEVVVVSRNPEKVSIPFADKVIALTKTREIINEISESRAVLNFSGAPINSTGKLAVIEDSRIKFTSNVVSMIRQASPKPAVFINGSAIGYYGAEESNDVKFTEESSAGKDYWGDLVSKWEEEAVKAEQLGVRVVNMRTSLFLDSDSGTLKEIIPLFRKHMGGYIKPGRQWVSWIHRDDEVALILECIRNEQIRGAINASSPNPVRMKEFTRAIGKRMGRSASLPIPSLAVKMKFGKAAPLLINGAAAMPEKAESIGFKFRYPMIDMALSSLISNRKD
ncbi:MAG: TIGR01777 family oxidoreductase [Thermoplasmataceae archaeon]